VSKINYNKFLASVNGLANQEISIDLWPRIRNSLHEKIVQGKEVFSFKQLFIVKSLIPMYATALCLILMGFAQCALPINSWQADFSDSTEYIYALSKY
jgi:hypothetical protein